MSQIFSSTNQSFYKIIIKSDKKINFQNYEINSFNSVTNVLCGKGDFQKQDNAFIISVQLEDFTPETQGYIKSIDVPNINVNERIPYFVLQHKKNKKQIELHQPLGSVDKAENYSLSESILKTISSQNQISENARPLYKPDDETRISLIDKVDKSFVPTELRKS